MLITFTGVSSSTPRFHRFWSHAAVSPCNAVIDLAARVTDCTVRLPPMFLTISFIGQVTWDFPAWSAIHIYKTIPFIWCAPGQNVAHGSAEQ